jgi:CRISPR-associated endoribonuclease Cas6
MPSLKGQHMPPLVALVIELRATKPLTINNHMGRAMQKFGLDLLGSNDPVLSKETHDADDIKPFTVSGLMRNHSPWYGDIAVGDKGWVRLTGLSVAVCEALLAFEARVRYLLDQHQPFMLDIDRVPWEVEAVYTTGHTWAGVSDFQTLLDTHQTRPLSHHFALSFVTPTTFRSNTVNMPLPLSHLVWGSLLTRWRAFSGEVPYGIPREHLEAFLAHHMVISQYDLKSQSVVGKQGGKEVGFVGSVRYTLTQESDYLQRHDPDTENHLQATYPSLARVVMLLAEFAFYSAVGRKTTTGMGMARSKNPSQT